MRQTRKASASFLLLMAVPERCKRIPPCLMGKAKKKRDLFFESSRKPCKTQKFLRWYFSERGNPSSREPKRRLTKIFTQRLYDPGKDGQSRKKLIQTDGEVQAMYLLFREHHLLLSAVMKLGYGELQVLYAFIRYEMEEREKEKAGHKIV